MKKVLVLFAVAATVLAACTREDIPINEEIQKPAPAKTVLTIGSDVTKTTVGDLVNGGRQVYWADGDQVCVNGVTSDPLTGITPNSLTKTAFSFTPTVSSPYNAVYPASIWKNSTTVTLPQAVKSQVIPLGGTSADDNISLGALTSALHLKLKLKASDPDTDHISLIEISALSTRLSGDFSINFGTGALTPAASPTANDKKILLTGDWALSDTPTDFFIPIPAGTHALTVKIMDRSGHYMEKVTSKTFVKGQILNLAALEFDPSYTESNVYWIDDADDLIAFADEFNNGDRAVSTYNAYLTSDIVFDATSASSFNSTGGIGKVSGRSYGSTFDGAGHSISGITATIPLFPYVATTGTVKSLTVSGSFVYSQPDATNDNFGTLAKHLQGALSGVTVTASASLNAGTNTRYIDFGGLVGRANNASASISNCHYNGDISIPSTYSTTSSIRLGGLVGYATKALTISSSSFGGTIKCLGGDTGTDTTDPELNVGGIVGRNQKATISGCTTYDSASKPSVKIDETTYSATILVQSSTYVFATIGGIVGWNYDGGSVTGCTNNASILDNVTKSDVCVLDVGGIVGNNDKARKLSDDKTSISVASVSSSTNNGILQHFSSSQTQHLGGVVGFDRGNYSGGTNNTGGELIINKAAWYPYVGGIIGEKAEGTFTGTISNKGAVTINALTAGEYGCKVGGVLGSTSVAIDGGGSKTISNTGTIRVSANVVTSGISCLGGVVGYSSANISNVSNGGGVEFNGKYVSSPSADATSNVSVGGILGVTESTITVTGCTNNGSAYYGKDSDTRVDNKDSFVGGIVGKMADGGTISSCSHKRRQIRNQNFNNTHTLAGGAFCGGIVGALVGTAEHLGSITSVTVSDMDDGKYCAYGKRGDNGGIAGYVSYTTINGTSCSGNTYGTNGSAKVAGAVAWMVASTLQNFTFTGNVMNGASTTLGGLVYTLDGSSEVKDCVFNGTMQYDGGVIAYTASAGAKITNCGVRGTKNGKAITTANSDILGTGSALITGTYAYPTE